MQTVVENPVGQSCSGFAQARTVMLGSLASADRPAAPVIDGIATHNVTMLHSAHRMMDAFDAAGRAARTALLDEANAIVGETIEFTSKLLQTRTLADLLDLQGSFARRRMLAAATFASAFLAPPLTHADPQRAAA